VQIFIKELREKAGIGLNELARRSDVAAGYISDLETGKKTNIGIVTLCKIANVLDVDVSDLFDC